MCGRFTLTQEAGEVQLNLGLKEMPPDWEPRYNIAPSQKVAVIKNSKIRKLEWLRWGLVPFWAKDDQIGNKLINARAETIEQKPSFKYAFEKRRCLILADGFYEWKKMAGGKIGTVPYYFSLRNRELFAFAGLWESWKTKDGMELQTCSIITCEANDIVSSIHNRMPVILTQENLWDWLDFTDLKMLKSLLVPLSPGQIQAYAVSNSVNNPSSDKKECIMPAEL